MSAQAFVPTNDLERAMHAAFLDPAANGDFLTALADQKVLVPVAAQPVGNRVEFPLFDVAGANHIAVFTSDSQLARANRAGADRLLLSGRDLASMWPAGVAMAINPGGDLGLSLPAEDVARLAAPPGGGVFERSIPAGSELIVGAPAQEPEALLDRVSAAAATLPEVRVLHRALVHAKDSAGTPRIVIGVEIGPKADQEAVLGRLAEVAGPDAGLLVLAPDARDPVSSWMREQDEPFYRAVE